MALKTSRAKGRGTGPTTSLLPTVRAYSLHSTLPKQMLTLRSQAVVLADPTHEGYAFSHFVSLLLFLMATNPRNRNDLLFLIARTFLKWMRFSSTLLGTSTSALTIMPPLPNQRFDLAFDLERHLEERTRASATAYRSFRLRRILRFTPRWTPSVLDKG
jgi:hypothetical protein